MMRSAFFSSLFLTIITMNSSEAANSFRGSESRFLAQVMCPSKTPTNADGCPSNVNESCGYDADGNLDLKGGTTICLCEELLGSNGATQSTYKWSCHEKSDPDVCPTYRPVTGASCASQDVGDHCLYDDDNTRCSCVHLLGSTGGPAWSCAEVCPANPEVHNSKGRECVHEKEVCEYPCGNCECVREANTSKYYWECGKGNCHV
jgi:hypothetical protein